MTDTITETIDYAPYSALVEYLSGRKNHVVIINEHGKEVARANYDYFQMRWISVRITTKDLNEAKDCISAMDFVEQKMADK